MIAPRRVGTHLGRIAAGQAIVAAVVRTVVLRFTEERMIFFVPLVIKSEEIGVVAEAADIGRGSEIIEVCSGVGADVRRRNILQYILRDRRNPIGRNFIAGKRQAGKAGAYLYRR
jgi:hypothetical protein